MEISPLHSKVKALLGDQSLLADYVQKAVESSGSLAQFLIDIIIVH